MRQKLFQLFILIVVGSILTTILTWPFLAKITSFYSDLGDYPTNGYVLWYNQLSLATGRILDPNLYFNSYQFYPWPYSAAYGEYLFIPSLIFSPVYWISQQLVFSVNLYIFLTFVLSFISSFYCLNYLIKNKYASLIGATVYAFNPMTFAHFPNHVSLMGKYFLPPVLLYGYLFFKKPETKTALFFFLFFTLNALTSFQFMFFGSFTLAVYFVFFFFLNFYRRNYTYFLNILKKSLLFLIFIPFLAFFYMPYLSFAQKEKANFDIQFVWLFSGRLEDWFSPLPNNLLYENILPTNRTEKILAGYNDISEEHTLFINTVPAILAILSLLFLLRSLRRRNQKESNDRLLLVVNLITLMVSAILSFGPNFSFNENQGSSIKLPFHYLMLWLPIFKGIRVPSRFQFIFYIPFSILVSYGSLIIFRLRKRYFLPIFIFRRKTVLWFISLAALLIVENLNNFKFDSTSSILKEKQFIEHNFGFLNNKGTLHFPIGYLFTEARYLNFGTQTKEKMINGYNSYMPSDWFSFMKAYQTSLEEDGLKKLKAIGIQYVIIHKDLLSKQQAQNLSNNKTTLQKGTIFDQEGIQVISLDKFDFNFKLCNFDKDFNFIFKRVSDYYQLSIENQSDCYLTSTFQDRYRSKIVYKNGTAKTAFIRMPIIIAPFEKISVDEPNRNLTLKQL